VQSRPCEVPIEAAELGADGAQGANQWRPDMTMDMGSMGTGAMLAMGIYHLAIFIFAVLGTAASTKYLRS
jgi:hypothetical protein